MVAATRYFTGNISGAGILVVRTRNGISVTLCGKDSGRTGRDIGLGVIAPQQTNHGALRINETASVPAAARRGNAKETSDYYSRRHAIWRT